MYNTHFSYFEVAALEREGRGVSWKFSISVFYAIVNSNKKRQADTYVGF